MIARKALVTVCALGLGAGVLATTHGAADAPGPSELTEPDRWTAEAPESFRARFECSNGDFVVEVTRALSPHGADRFYNLVRSGFFDGARFFRVMPGFIVQFGLNGTPAVNRAWFRARIPDDQVHGSNTAGTISFATSGPNSRTTQVFINLADNVDLDVQGFSPFGRVVAGIDVVTAIEPQYGQQPSQGLIRTEGNAYLHDRFPELDFVRQATIDGDESTPHQAREAPETR